MSSKYLFLILRKCSGPSEFHKSKKSVYELLGSIVVHVYYFQYKYNGQEFLGTI